MNATEFRRWYKSHRAAFPGLEGWLDGIASRGGEDPISKSEVLKTWQVALSDVPVERAFEATKRMHRGDEETPKWFEDHPRVVRAVARRCGKVSAQRWAPPRMVDGEVVFDCPICQDVGLVTVFGRKAHELAEAGDLDAALRTNTYACRCSCERGQRIHLPDSRGDELETFDPRNHAAWSCIRDVAIENLQGVGVRVDRSVPFDPAKF